MKKLLKITATLFGFILLVAVVITLLTPWMDRWGATDEEVSAVYPGDELVPEPASFVNRAITIQASPEEIYPWIVQLGAEKGGWYSHTWLETYILQCPIVNADRIHPEWQDLKVGDQVKMCPNEPPPPYEVAQIIPNQVVVMGHRENNDWVDLWQFVLLPQSDGSTRLVLRTRTMMVGGFWTIIHPGVFVMEYGLLHGIQERAQAMADLPATTIELATPTPEIFNPLNPSPTPSESDLPLTCQVTDLKVYIDRPVGYCFAYPNHFSLGDQPLDGPQVMGSVQDDSLQSVRVSLGITVQPVPDGSKLPLLVDAYLSTFTNPPWPITREVLTLGSEPAEKLEPVPGLGSARVLLLLHNNTLFTLSFHPVDLEVAKPDLDALYQTVTGSFTFLPATAKTDSTVQTVSWSEFGKNLSLSYDPLLAPWVTAQTVPAVTVSDQILFAEARPAYAQFRFYGFQGGRLYDLPQLPFDNRMAQVMIFRTADFPGYGDETPYGFVNQLQALKDLLANGMEPAQCAKPYVGTVAPLPFLPWINYQQVFCAQPQILQFSGGQGIRYLSYYSQGINPVLDHEVFYTFQGLTDDGQFYISALFPVATGIFPIELPPCPKCSEEDYNPSEEWALILTEQLSEINTLEENVFAPALSLLDAVVKSIQISQ